MQAKQLSNADMLAGVPKLFAKIAHFQPAIICFVGGQVGNIFCAEIMKLEAKNSATAFGSGTKVVARRAKGQGKKPKEGIEWGMRPLKIVHSPIGTCTTSCRDCTISPVLSVTLPTDEGKAKETLIFVMPSSSAGVTQYQVRWFFPVSWKFVAEGATWDLLL